MAVGIDTCAPGPAIHANRIVRIEGFRVMSRSVDKARKQGMKPKWFGFSIQAYYDWWCICIDSVNRSGISREIRQCRCLELEKIQKFELL